MDVQIDRFVDDKSTTQTHSASHKSPLSRKSSDRKQELNTELLVGRIWDIPSPVVSGMG